MTLTKDQILFNYVSTHKTLMGIGAISSSSLYENKFRKSPGAFFKALKNGLNSLGGIPNRSFFKGLSGCYFSYHDNQHLEMIIFYDTSITSLNPLQVEVRIKKLLGFTTIIEFGDFNHFSDRVSKILSINRNSQSFGDFYFNQSVMAV